MSPRRRLKVRYETEADTRPHDVPPEPTPAPEVANDAPPVGKAVIEELPASAVQVLADDGAEIHDPVEATTAEPVLEAVPATADDALPAPAVPRPGHRVAAFFLMIGLALIAFTTGVLVFNGLVMPRLIHGIGQVEVPDVRNLTLDQAEQALRSAGLQLSREGERFDPGVPRGFVLSQDPAPGTSVRGRRRVSVVVSLGEEFSSVPELFGESQRTAEHLVRSAGLQLGAITRAPSDQVGEGLVVGSDPGPESVLPQGSIVSLLVSTGAGEESYVMPDLLGREISGVRRQLEALGFRVVALPGERSVGTIVAQRPEAGSRIARNDPITLQASGRVIR